MMMKNTENLLILQKQLHCVIAKNRAVLSDDIFLLVGTRLACKQQALSYQVCNTRHMS